MNRFDEMFEFRLANYNDIDAIMKFIRNYWGRKEHILGTNREFFEYEFCDDERVGYFLATDKITGEIVAAEGIYYYSKPHQQGVSDISAGMLLANPTCKVPLIGLELMKRKNEVLKPRVFVSPGTNMSTSGQLYIKVLKNDTCRMKHFYILSDRDVYKVAKISKKKQIKSCSEKAIDLYKVDNVEELYNKFDDVSYRNRKPYKDKWYITKRYFNHPKYKYHMYCIAEKAVLVCREVEACGVKVLRIVDILGDLSVIAYIGDSLKNLLYKYNYEYVDIYEVGMNEEDLMKAGFIERVQNDENIIPNYFDPFEQHNVEIYAVRTSTQATVFRGDGDMDRPNSI